MILYHYGETPYLDLTRTYPINGRGGYGKPCGLWLSDDSNYGWNDWCLAEQYSLGEHRFRVILHSEANILHINNGEQLWAFHNKYCALDDFNRRYQESDNRYWMIDWPTVKADFDGILITPYLWSHRLQGPHWYYAWDCASGCFWNLSVIKSVEPAPLPALLQGTS